MGRFYATQELSEHLSKTPEGYLLCEGVPIARTGEQLYACTEVPIEPTASGMIRVLREPEEVFRPETIASFEGKPATLKHPEEQVAPENWREVTVGTAMNVRRGSGIEDDYLFADILITDAAAIAAVEEAKAKGTPMQISCGYDAMYEQIEPGVGRQLNIVGNHVALVERGRAGPRCAIKDEEIIMATKPTKTPAKAWWDRAAAAVLGRDPAAMRTVIHDADGPGGEPDEDDEDKATKDDVAEVKKTCDALQKTVDGLPAVIAKAVRDAMEEAEEGKKKETDDEVALAAEQAKKIDGGDVMTGDALPALMSKVEILSPGYPVPTGDAVSGKGAAVRIMRGALVKAVADAKTAPHLAPIVAGVDLSKATHDAIRPLFAAAVEVMRVRNNAAGRTDAPRTVHDFGRTVTADALNKSNADFWAKRRAA